MAAGVEPHLGTVGTAGIDGSAQVTANPTPPAAPTRIYPTPEPDIDVTTTMKGGVLWTGQTAAMKPAQLAKELGVSASTIRRCLQRLFPRPASDRGKPWDISPEQAAVIRKELKPRRKEVRRRPPAGGTPLPPSKGFASGIVNFDPKIFKFDFSAFKFDPPPFQFDPSEFFKNLNLSFDPSEYMVEPSVFKFEPAPFQFDPSEFFKNLNLSFDPGKYMVEPSVFNIEPQAFRFDPSEFFKSLRFDPEALLDSPESISDDEIAEALHGGLEASGSRFNLDPSLSNAQQILVLGVYLICTYLALLSASKHAPNHVSGLQVLVVVLYQAIQRRLGRD